ncbi:YmaF family protein [Paenibacillus apiarius]|uniref:YmaF family protein n=1 Tax=Paenibacillus apiarius TaxID=46240 RepID=A0ABT4DWF6_9BACL|nr:YmaF family protein [Paenibacillus apiarius]MCY9518001.1 YmaF family protein [Paenibacillus apiarius]MCY9521687.1 YmaF family protein [Paenibacillus apiarius]MCY9554305.1 YmaF family protein [Paenibacillus apiarius]MCY9561383.1 YmaF family protein [Paenibacillus apiarius]MCY9685029.1 YmaF family protein [Paenibacillus apiarius]
MGNRLGIKGKSKEQSCSCNQGHALQVRFQHRMSGRSSLTEGHRHRFRNLTDRFIPGRGTHRHTFNGITQVADGHRHAYSGITGPALNGQGPRHFHRFRQVTRVADGHTHIISGRTSVPIRVSGSAKHRHGLIVESIKRS